MLKKFVSLVLGFTFAFNLGILPVLASNNDSSSINAILTNEIGEKVLALNELQSCSEEGSANLPSSQLPTLKSLHVCTSDEDVQIYIRPNSIHTYMIIVTPKGISQMNALRMSGAGTEELGAGLLKLAGWEASPGRSMTFGRNFDRILNSMNRQIEAGSKVANFWL